MFQTGALQEDHEKLQGDVEHLKNDIKDLNIANGHLHNDNLLLEASRQQADDNVQQLHTDLDISRNQTQHLTNQVYNLIGENQQLRGELRRKTRMVERSSEGLQLASAEVRSCERKLVKKSVMLTMEKELTLALCVNVSRKEWYD